MDVKDHQDAVDAMSTRAFLIGRTKETIQVPVSGLGGTKYIEIRLRLSREEMKRHEYFLERWKKSQESNMMVVESEFDEKAVCAFVEHITIDPEITYDFLLNSGLSPDVCDDILMAYFITEPTRRMVEIQKFLLQRLRSRI